MNKLCIYHGNCADGFGAAWVVRSYHEATEFFAGHYGKPPPDVTGRDVIMVDFSYKRPVLLEMAAKAKSILILDHHKTAELDLVDLPQNVGLVFDMKRSGAMIAWDHFYPGVSPLPLIRYIQDRDLWQFNLPGSKEVSQALFSYPYDFDVWSGLMFPSTLEKLTEEGGAIERKLQKDLAELIPQVKRRMVIGGYDVPVAGLPYMMASEAGNLMAQGEPFAAVYYDTATARKFSLRSTDAGIDASVIASSFGGGGHRNACGFEVPRNHPLAQA